SSESGVGDGAGFTRRGRDDCACAGKTLTATMTKASMLRANNEARIGVTFRLIITTILSDLHQRFNENGKRSEACIRMLSPCPRFAKNAEKRRAAGSENRPLPVPGKGKLEVQLQAKLELPRIEGCRRPAVVPAISGPLSKGVHVVNEG